MPSRYLEMTLDLFSCLHHFRSNNRCLHVSLPSQSVCKTAWVTFVVVFPLHLADNETQLACISSVRLLVPNCVNEFVRSREKSTERCVRTVGLLSSAGLLLLIHTAGLSRSRLNKPQQLLDILPWNIVIYLLSDPLNLPITPPWGWHLWFEVKCLHVQLGIDNNNSGDSLIFT